MKRYKSSEGTFNIWTVFTDVALCFLIIIILFFVINTVRLDEVIKEKEELAQYAQIAKDDMNTLIGKVRSRKDLQELLGKDETTGREMITFSGKLTWNVNNQYQISDLDPNARQAIESFGQLLKEFLDEFHYIGGKKQLRRDSYTILIIGHANAIGKGVSDNYGLSHRRAESVRTHLISNIFPDQEGYKLLATGVGDHRLVKIKDKINGDRCIEIAFKFDEMDMVRGQ